MNSKLEDTILNDRRNLIPGTILYTLSNLINRNGKWYCIVEGKTDQYFYSNIKNIDLKNSTYYLYGKNKDLEQGGKNTVINSYNIIKKIPRLNKFMNKYIFIIDHDYVGLTSEEIEIDYDSYTNITITKPYSFENYFLTEKNIKTIFKYFNIENDSDNFINLYNAFAKEIQEYTRLKSSTIEIKQKQSKYYDQYCSSYIKKYSYDEIFDFDFSDGKLNYNRKYLYEEISLLKRYVNNNNNARQYYLNQSIDLVKNNDFIRGHNAFDFLIKYLQQVHNIIVDIGNNDQYSKLVKILDVDINIKNAIGDSITKSI